MPDCSITLANLTAIDSLAATLDDLTDTIAAHSAALSCDSGRRLEADKSFASAKEVIKDYLTHHPDFAANLSETQRAHMEQLGQHFGLPVHAQDE